MEENTRGSAEPEATEPANPNGIETPVVPEPKEELSPERKAELRKAAIASDIMVSCRQDVEGMDMNAERLAVYKKFWQRRYAETKDKDKEAHKKAEESLMQIEKQLTDIAFGKGETGHMMKFLDSLLKGEIKIED